MWDTVSDLLKRNFYFEEFTHGRRPPPMPMLMLMVLFSYTAASQLDAHFVTQHIPAAIPSNTIDASRSSLTFSTHFLITKTSTTIHKNDKQCRTLRTDIDWSAQVESSVYSTPVIRTAATESRYASHANSIIASTYVHFIESLQAKNGHVLPGWPLEFDKSEFPTSPILYDVDHDGHKEIVAVDKSGKLFVLYLTDGGNFLRDDVVAPFRLRVSNNLEKNLEKASNGLATATATSTTHTTAATTQWEWITRVLSLEHQEKPRGPESSQGIKSNTVLGPGHRVIDSRQQQQNAKNIDKATVKLNNDDKEDDWREQSWKELTESVAVESGDTKQRGGRDEEGRNDNGSWTVLSGHVLATPVLHDDGNLYVVTSHFVDNNNNDDNFKRAGNDNNVARWSAVSVTRWSLGKNCGQIVVPPATSATSATSATASCKPSTYPSVQWTVVLETSQSDRLTAYSAPLLADLNGNGVLDLIVATSSGKLHRLNAKTGKPLEFGKIRMAGEVQADLSVEDVTNESSNLNIIVCDMKGNIFCFNHNGISMWDVNVGGQIPSGPTLVRRGADVNIHVVTSTGHLWSLNGKDGKVLKGYPVKLTNARLVTSIAPMVVRRPPPTLSAVTEDTNSWAEEELYLIVPGLDGKLHVMNDRTQCVTLIDIGEHVYADVLVRGTLPNQHVHFHHEYSAVQKQPQHLTDHHSYGHRDNGGVRELTSFVVATMHGNIMSFVVDDSEYATKDRWDGKAPRAMTEVVDGAITLVGGERSRHVVSGHTFHVRVFIHAARKRRQGPYRVIVRCGSHIIREETYRSSGEHTMSLSLHTPGIFVLDVTSTNARGQSYTTELVVDYNTQVATSMIPMVTIPMVVFTALVVVLSQMT